MSAWRVPKQRDVDLHDGDVEWMAAVRAEIARTPTGAHVPEATWIALATGDSAGEAVEALAHVARCGECRDVLRAVRALREESAAITGADSLAPRRTAWTRWLAAAAVLAVIGAGWLARRPTPVVDTTAAVEPQSGMRTPPKTSPPPPTPSRPDWLRATPPSIALYSPGALTMRGGDRGAFPDALAEALVPWRGGRYAEAADRLAALASTYPDAVEVPFYQGVARLLSRSPQRAIPLLQRALDAAPPALRADAAWYLALARLDAAAPGAAEAFTEACEAGHARACQAAEHVTAGTEAF